jgi:hypothetical protein
MAVVRISKGKFVPGNLFEAERLLSESRSALDQALAPCRASSTTTWGSTGLRVN